MLVYQEMSMEKVALEILLGVDHEGLRLALANWLEGIGHRVATAADSQQLCESLKEKGFDLLVLDDGLADDSTGKIRSGELLPKLRSHHRHRSVRVVVLNSMMNSGEPLTHDGGTTFHVAKTKLRYGLQSVLEQISVPPT